MKRIAFFVEGLTESLFLSRLITELFGKKHIAIEISKIQGGTRVKHSFTSITAADVTSDTKYYILIYDCGGDANIKSYIMENREKLIRTGYSKVIGLRDVFPLKKEDVTKLNEGLYCRIPQKPIPIDFLLSIMEIEAWFLSEVFHFPKIDNKLTIHLIKENLSFDPATDNMQEREAPANDLDNCYRLVNKRYKKNEASIQRTIDALDFTNVYINLRLKVGSLNKLIQELETFIN